MADDVEAWRAAFERGAAWAGWKYTLVGDCDELRKSAKAEARKLYKTKHVVRAPSGRWYGLSGQWRELRGYESEAKARSDQSTGSWTGVLAGDEKAAAELLLRIAADTGAT